MWLTDDFVKEIVEEVADNAVDLAEPEVDDAGEVNEDGEKLDESGGEIEKLLEDFSACIMMKPDMMKQSRSRLILQWIIFLMKVWLVLRTDLK